MCVYIYYIKAGDLLKTLDEEIHYPCLDHNYYSFYYC